MEKGNIRYNHIDILVVTILKKIFMTLNKHDYAFNQLWGLSQLHYSKKNPQTRTRIVSLLKLVYLKEPTFCHLGELD